ncbi:2-pyrone-4,6-dicarboxylate hydrolase [Roseibium hamelinense]|nr:2-pyrone-4,6-dicarboxylate hydrolase [Roseibium hamelinense]
MPVFDAHLHIIPAGFPLVENQGFRPEPFDVSAYRKVAKPLGIVGGTVVSGSFQGTDQTYLQAALAALGASYAGVTNLPAGATDKEILELARHGIRAARINLYRGSPETAKNLPEFAARLWELAGWHIEVYASAGAILELEPVFAGLPKLSLDHLGMQAAALPALLRLAGGGVKVKATGFGRVDLNVADTLNAIANANPDALMFGTDLPSTRANRPFSPADIDLINQTLTGEQARKALFENAAEFYGLEAGPH